jgi:antagonist of KipI
MMVFELAGISSVQDLGRPGYQNQGIGESGAMDRFALRVANSLLANDENTGAIEITFGHVRMRTQNTQWFALTGADLSASLNGQVFPLCQPVFVPADSVIEFKKPLRGCRAYLAVQGGFELVPVLGSVATDVRSGLGGLHGTWLKKNDSVAFKHAAQELARQVHWHTHYANPAFARTGPLHFIPDRLWHKLGEQVRLGFLSHHWHIAPESDRMGIRLADSLPQDMPDPALNIVPNNSPGGSLLSSAVAFGSIQVPPDNRPIILAADRQTTGGYPLLGTLASISHSCLAQLKPDDAVRFELIELADAQSEWRQRELAFRQWQTHCRNWWQSTQGF